MNLNNVPKQLQAMQQQIAQLLAIATDTPLSSQQRESIATAFQELSTTVEALHTSHQAIERQNQEYKTAYQALQAQCQQAQAAQAESESRLRTTGLIGVALDITQRQQAEDALQQLTAELEDRVQERSANLEQKNQQLKREIAQHRETLKALRQSEHRFKKLAANVPGVIYQYLQGSDGSQSFPYFSASCRELLELEPELLQAQGVQFLWDGIHPDDYEAFQNSIRLSCETLQPWYCEWRSITPSGKIKWLQGASRPERLANGDILWDGLLMDITDRKAAEDALKDSEERFRQLAENIHEVFWMTSLNGTQKLYISPGYEEIWGRSCESVYEQPLSWLEAIHPDDRDRIIAALVNFPPGELDEEFRIVRPDGSIRWIRDRGFPVRNAQGEVYRLAGIAEDITSRKQAEEETYKALQRERELSELKTHIVAVTSHEFRNPLAMIQSSAQMLERYQDILTPDKQRKHLQRIQIAVDRMTQMLDDILIVSKAESGKLEFNPTPIDLIQVCRNLVEDLRLVNKKQQVIQFTYSGYSILAIPQEKTALPQLDEKLLRHVLNNLLGNAIKYSPNGSTITLNLSCTDYKAIFQIQDEGIGIPFDDKTRLFESFHRASNVGTIQGTGLGLAIVKECVDLHGGEITVESEVGKGTTFTVTLPFNKENPFPVSVESL